MIPSGPRPWIISSVGVWEGPMTRRISLRWSDYGVWDRGFWEREIRLGGPDLIKWVLGWDGSHPDERDWKHEKDSTPGRSSTASWEDLEGHGSWDLRGLWELRGDLRAKRGLWQPAWKWGPSPTTAIKWSLPQPGGLQVRASLVNGSDLQNPELMYRCCFKALSLW